MTAQGCVTRALYQAMALLAFGSAVARCEKALEFKLNEITSWEMNCYDTGLQNEEYRRQFFLDMSGDGSVISACSISCDKCDSYSGYCSRTFSSECYVRTTFSGATYPSFAVRFNAWEDDGGSDCGYDSGDDCAISR